MPGIFQVGGLDVDVLAAALRGDKTKALGVHGQIPGHQVHLVGEPEALPFDEHHVPPGHEALQAFLHPGALLRGESQQLQDFLQQQGPTGLTQDFQELLFALRPLALSAGHFFSFGDAALGVRANWPLAPFPTKL